MQRIHLGTLHWLFSLRVILVYGCYQLVLQAGFSLQICWKKNLILVLFPFIGCSSVSFGLLRYIFTFNLTEFLILFAFFGYSFSFLKNAFLFLIAAFTLLFNRAGLFFSSGFSKRKTAVHQWHVYYSTPFGTVNTCKDLIPLTSPFNFF